MMNPEGATTHPANRKNMAREPRQPLLDGGIGGGVLGSVDIALSRS
jgi:hypothetical protein